MDVSAAAGLRLVEGSLELLDAVGTPRVRVAPPYVVGATGVVRPATLAVDGCAFDTSPKAPWNRPVTPPGAARCTLRVSWNDVLYPAIVDPAWTSTGSMSTDRYLHTATLPPSGRVLVAGGINWPGITVYLRRAEIYDPTTGTFAVTGSFLGDHVAPTADLLGSGKVLVVGYGSGAELYDEHLFPDERAVHTSLIAHRDATGLRPRAHRGRSR